MMRSASWFAQKRGRRDENHKPIAKALAKLGFLVFDVAGSMHGVDLFVRHGAWASGRWEPLEIKTEGGDVSDSQVLLHAQWAAKGVKVHVVRDLDEALVAMRRSP